MNIEPIDSETAQMVAFPLLADPERYMPNTIDMVNDARALRIWLAIFRDHIERLQPLAAESLGNTTDAKQRAAEMGNAFRAFLDDLQQDARAHGGASVPRICTERERLLRTYGFPDPYKAIKDAENASALVHLPALLAELDAMDEQLRLQRIIEGIFAGNIFDLGCAGTTKLFESGEADFHRTRDRLPDRPWCVDDFDLLRASMHAKRYRKAILFVDNAGADVVLGMIPFARFLLQRETQVVLTANSSPALNDILIDELHELLEQIATIDQTIREGLETNRLRGVPSGNGIPLIDLRSVDVMLAEEAADADLLVLEGMGRSLETNFHAKFTIDTLKLAMIKEEHVAEVIGGKMYGVVCRFESS